MMMLLWHADPLSAILPMRRSLEHGTMSPGWTKERLISKEMGRSF
jgi:hypothetical protein